MNLGGRTVWHAAVPYMWLSCCCWASQCWWPGNIRIRASLRFCWCLDLTDRTATAVPPHSSRAFSSAPSGCPPTHPAAPACCSMKAPSSATTPLLSPVSEAAAAVCLRGPLCPDRPRSSPAAHPPRLPGPHRRSRRRRARRRHACRLHCPACRRLWAPLPSWITMPTTPPTTHPHRHRCGTGRDATLGSAWVVCWAKCSRPCFRPLELCSLCLLCWPADATTACSGRAAALDGALPAPPVACRPSPMALIQRPRPVPQRPPPAPSQPRFTTVITGRRRRSH